MSPLISVTGLHSTVPRWLIPVAKSAFAGDTATSEKPDFMDSLNSIRDEDPKSIAYAMRSILLGREDEHALLATIDDVPVLVLAGEEDRQFSVETVRTMARAIPGSRFVVLPKTAHLSPLESPQEVNAPIDAFIDHRAGTEQQPSGQRADGRR